MFVHVAVAGVIAVVVSVMAVVVGVIAVVVGVMAVVVGVIADLLTGPETSTFSSFDFRVSIACIV